MIRMQADVISKFKLHDRQIQSFQQDFLNENIDQKTGHNTVSNPRREEVGKLTSF